MKTFSKYTEDAGGGRSVQQYYQIHGGIADPDLLRCQHGDTSRQVFARALKSFMDRQRRLLERRTFKFSIATMSPSIDVSFTRQMSEQQSIVCRRHKRKCHKDNEIDLSARGSLIILFLVPAENSASFV